ncbi:hypothetical protein ACFQ05_03390 [Amycolatopsis umgeniensis]|uniref:Uncharacterized protein n=1 Tax=Amycolatopsis umgeniensis TaxID=336628 RepID=A0A841B0U3_9PSEU|nr:hypothetical protein [Amycolatopsis umgeniensis]MBB5852305.1 hypothetical protein [Amycolatopsis umgeniensis]
MVHSVAAGERVSAAIRTIEREPGIQVVFTWPPGPAEELVRDYLAMIGALTTPWERAIRERFDLVITTDPAETGILNGALLVLPAVSADGDVVGHSGRRCATTLAYVFRQRLGRREPMLIGLPHLWALTRLRASAPQVGRQATVIGDPGYDELLEACHEQAWAHSGRRQGLVLSTRGPDSLFGRTPAVLQRLVSDLPSQRISLACRLDPEVWARHGRRQLLAWAGRSVRERVDFLQPEHDWRAVAAAADFVVGDHGHDTACAAAAEKPVYLANPVPKIEIGPLSEAVAKYGTVLDPKVPLAPQLRWTPRPGTQVVRRITSAPGESASLLRRECFRLMRLTGPAFH